MSARYNAIPSFDRRQRALPHLRHMDPQRVGLVLRALERLQLLQQEGVILMMPEMQIGR